MNVRHVASEPSPNVMHAVRRAARTVLAHPSLWLPAVVGAARFAPSGWWRRPPFLPYPDERYWRFRMETAYGSEEATVSADELVAVLRWSRRSAGRHQ